MSCREICRRTFRGCLRIPGCKTVCYKCFLRPCCSSDSDDEKDEKDDEGYDSYGINASQNHLPEPKPLLATDSSRPHTGDLDNHDYINEPAIGQASPSEVDKKLGEVMYVSMYDSDENNDDTVALKLASGDSVLDTSTCNNNKHDYVNESVLFKKSNHDGDFSNGDIFKHTSKEVKSDFVNGRGSVQRQDPQQVMDSSTIKEYETRSLESKVADAVSNQQTLILLETDL